MSLITTMTRNWLTRSTKPFLFENKYDDILDYKDCENLGLYVHIPFCKKICEFCPYCKTIYDTKACDEYIDYLLKEIEMVGQMYDNQRQSLSTESLLKISQSCEYDTPHKKTVTSLYFGGGSPALAANRIDEIISKIQEYFIITEGIGVELHPEDLTISTLSKLKNAGVDKISIGIQSFQSHSLSMLGRSSLDINKIKEAINSVEFETVSMDFIFALPNQTIDDLKYNIDTAFTIGANHIAIYPFIDFTFTNKENKIPTMDKKTKRKLLDEVTLYCQSKGYTRDSIWTFSKNHTAKYSSMTRDNFLGFGCSATTLLKNQFKVNTFSVDGYKDRISKNKLPTALTTYFTKRQRMIYYLFWTAYTTRINSDDFNKFFGKSLKKMYGLELFIAKLLGFIIEKDGIYQMTLKGAFYYHYYENYYTLSYIDKMWYILGNESFPEKIVL